MQEISFEEYKEMDANPMVGVTADERTFFRLEEDKLGVFGKSEEDGETRFRASVLRPSSYFNGQFRSYDSKFDSGKTEKSIERAKENVMEWLKNQQEE